MQFYRVKNWSRFQHYKERNPPWIKLHFEILSSTDWVILDDASRVLAVASMLIASRNNGLVPSDPNYIKRVAYLNKAPNFKPLLDCGFLEITQADASVLQADARPETETYSKEKEEESNPLPPLPDWIPKQDWDDWIAQRKKKPTERALQLAIKKLDEFRSEGFTPDSVLQHCIMNGYQGLFKPTVKGNNYGKAEKPKQKISNVVTL